MIVVERLWERAMALCLVVICVVIASDSASNSAEMIGLIVSSNCGFVSPVCVLPDVSPLYYCYVYCLLHCMYTCRLGLAHDFKGVGFIDIACIRV